MIPSPLDAWVERRACLPSRFNGAQLLDVSSNKWSVSVALDESVPLHAAATVSWQSLKESRRRTSDYLQRAEALIDGLWGGSLDSEEQSIVLQALGRPPQFCLPIYMVTVGDADEERVVYVGKTRSSTRFRGGHPVALKLHEPTYNGLNKRIYRCSVLLDLHDEFVALEWIEPIELAEEVLDVVESVLIYALQPGLNSAKRKQPKTRRPVDIHIQNYAGSTLLDNLMLWHVDGEPLSFVPAN